MGLLDDLREAKVKKGPQCSSKRLLNDLSDSDKLDIQKAYKEENVPVTIILKVLREKYQLNLKSEGFRRHLKGECSCESF